MRILIVEDETETRDFLKLGLEAESYAVDTAADGDKGSYIARTNEYDVIILDNSLPKKQGDEVCADIRRNHITTPILMLSIHKEISKKVHLLDSGADDYLTKPFSFDELLARIRALIRRPKQIEQTVLEVDNIVLDTNKQTVRRGGKSIYLTRKEFTLLEYLMRNQGNVLSRGMIMEHVWNIERDPFSNTIEAHILNLRRKLRIGTKKEIIFNVPGRGYKIDVTKD